MKNLQQKTRSLPKVTSHSASAVGPKVNSGATKVSQGGGSSTKMSPTAAGRLRELPSTPAAAGGEAKKGSTVTSRAREREADFQKQVMETETKKLRLAFLLFVVVFRSPICTFCALLCYTGGSSLSTYIFWFISLFLLIFLILSQ